VRRGVTTQLVWATGHSKRHDVQGNPILDGRLISERLTERKVRAFISGMDPVSDIASEMFILHPTGYDGPSRSKAEAVAGGAMPC